MTGFVPFEKLRFHMTAEKIARAERETPGIGGVLCRVFPYFAGNAEGNISLYARGRDYHEAVTQELDAEIAVLRTQYPGGSFRAYADISPFPEVYAAACAGLGVIGKNGLLITPEYGSFVFIGLIATDLRWQEAADAAFCMGCGACERACPTGALKNGRVEPDLCISELTQRKGELSDAQTSILRNSPTVWGCDLCQLACPMNRDVSPVPDNIFGGELLCSLELCDLPETNAGFRRKYAGWAFTWRGVAPLLRNLTLKKSAE